MIPGITNIPSAGRSLTSAGTSRFLPILAILPFSTRTSVSGRWPLVTVSTVRQGLQGCFGRQAIFRDHAPQVFAGFVGRFICRLALRAEGEADALLVEQGSVAYFVFELLLPKFFDALRHRRWFRFRG